MSQGQARPRHRSSRALLACVGLLAGCSDPISKPVDLFHGLEGGEIAAERPPPPGAGQPYPHIGTVPDRPTLPTQGFRTALYSQLAAERDQKELLAADMPLEKVPPPPTPAPPKPAAAETSEPAPGATPTPGATGNDATDTGATNATIEAADAPPAKAGPAAPASPPPPHDATLQIAGDPVSTDNLPLVPDAPPPPPSLSDVAPQPPPTPRLAPSPTPLPSGGKPIYFAGGSDVVQASQNETLSDVAGRRGKTGVIDVIGLGDADSDTPLGQEAAIDLGLRRARAVAIALAGLHVPQTAIRISARPFGRGALVRVLP